MVMSSAAILAEERGFTLTEVLGMMNRSEMFLELIEYIQEWTDAEILHLLSEEVYRDLQGSELVEQILKEYVD
tara:strand:- start:202 stop:420 length:219 start_codon:yes stop_codon:yes gene_type:complete